VAVEPAERPRATAPGRCPLVTPTNAGDAHAEIPVVEPAEAATLGASRLVLAVLRSAEAPLSQPQITERVRHLNPRCGGEDVKGALYQLYAQKIYSPVARRGATGKFVYFLRSGPFDNGLPDVSKIVEHRRAVNTNAVSGPEMLQWILAELAERPTNDYQALARTLLGTDDRRVVKRVRDRVLHLHETHRVRRRSDGAWEVPVLH
jgi:hypothetical protein